MEKYTLPHIRLGGTSFLLHEEYVPALRFAAARCEDIALLLLQAGQDGELLPGPEEIREIGTCIAAGVVKAVFLKVGDKISESTAIIEVETAGSVAAPEIGRAHV